MILDLPNCECDASGKQNGKKGKSYEGPWCIPKETPCNMLTGNKSGDTWDWLKCDVQVQCDNHSGNKRANAILKVIIKISI